MRFSTVSSRAAMAASFIFCTIVAARAASAAAPGGYSPAQASAGATVYASNCATCHAQKLTGGSGPALVGASFHRSIEANYKTAGRLYDFVSKQMPLSAPGSLSSQSYLAVSAYILKANGYDAGSTALSKSSASSVRLADVKTENGSAFGQADEIVRAAPPTTVRFGPMPAGANVDITDEMLGNAGADDKDWLIGGKTYANDRYSALAQITSTNVGSLVPVAVVQTGMTASFEDTPIVVDGVMYVSDARGRTTDESDGTRRDDGCAHLGDHVQSRVVQDLLRAGESRRGRRVRPSVLHDARRQTRRARRRDGQDHFRQYRRRSDGRLFGNDDAAGLQASGHRRQRGRRMGDPGLRRLVRRDDGKTAVALAVDRS